MKALENETDPGLLLFKSMFEQMDQSMPLEPAFEHFLHFRAGKKHGMIRCHQSVFDYVEDSHSDIESLNSRYQPMVIPPLKWVAPDIGGYLITTAFPARTQFMRTKSASLQGPPLQDSNLSTIYKALDVLAAHPWKINSDILRIQEQAWAEGGGIAEIPSKRQIPFPAPLSPEQMADKALARQYRREYAKIQQLNYDAHGLRCCFRYQLKVAQDFQGLAAIYFPHNVDFRGRAYPIPPHLNHMGADVCRGLLTFSEAKPLGEGGFRWLKVHLCNLFGNNKMSFDDRVKFVDSHLDDIFDSARQPLTGKRWWAEAEEPWQALAACLELTKAIDSGDPINYLSSIPIHADGSCNGLQHYAALGGDTFGAKQVNLYPDVRPVDVYSGVAQLVAEKVHLDAQDPNAEDHEIAKVLDGRIQRRTIKQTVMTKVYGVTRMGARLQISNALEDLKTLPQTEDDDANDAMLFQASRYLTRLTFESLQHMFGAATTIMAWLQQCAGLIAAKSLPVGWVSPIGLPIYQHYRRPSKRRISTIVQNVSLADSEGQPVSVSCQRSAFPPNYVHSLDSSHMFFTALRMHQESLPFASVHDSYWTHACHVDRMGILLREEFVRLHSQPLLLNLHQHFKTTHRDIDFPPVPERGDFDLKNVLTSPYFFH